MTSLNYQEEIKALKELEEYPYLAFEKDFLRWMLSDGAGAFLLESEKPSSGLSLKIDWIEASSYAHMIEPCMYMAAEKMSDGYLKSFIDFSSEECAVNSVMSLKQDIKLLSKNIIRLGFDKLKEILVKRNKNVDELTYFLPHLSSFFFEQPIEEILQENGMHIPKEKWFTNLADTGNVGSASIYLMFDELMKSNKLKKGDQVMFAVPESARFSYVFTWLTVC